MPSKDDVRNIGRSRPASVAQGTHRSAIHLVFLSPISTRRRTPQGGVGTAATAEHPVIKRTELGRVHPDNERAPPTRW
jgi:hypothetical protein